MNKPTDEQPNSPDIPPPVPVESDHSIICGFWSRLMALILDGFCLGLLGVILGLFLFDPLSHLGGWGRLIGFSISLVYFGVLNSSIGKGQTIGKRIMKIVVVDRAGSHISLALSLVRYTVLGIPFFLNGAMIPPSVMISPIGYLIGFILFGFGGAIIYLYIFNRRTRQSLHDLAVGSFVTKKTSNGQIVGSIWRPHLIVIAVWLVAVIGLSVVMTGLTKKGMFSELLSVQSAIQSSGKVHMVSVVAGKSWSNVGGNRSETTYLQSNAVWKERPSDNEAAARQIAALILQNYSGIVDKDILAVTITYGYDIGIARAWRTQRVQHSPSEWQAILFEPSTQE